MATAAWQVQRKLGSLFQNGFADESRIDAAHPAASVMLYSVVSGYDSPRQVNQSGATTGHRFESVAVAFTSQVQMIQSNRLV